MNFKTMHHLKSEQDVIISYWTRVKAMQLHYHMLQLVPEAGISGKDK